MSEHPQTAIRGVILDYGGVVLLEDRDDYDRIGSRHGLQPGQFWSAFHRIPEYLLYSTGKLGRDLYRTAVSGQLAEWIGEAQSQAAMEEWSQHWRGVLPIRSEMKMLIDMLKARVRIALLSNAGAGLGARLEKAGVARLFDVVLCSGDIGIAKPAPAAFALAANRLGLLPAECLFVDDSQEHVAGARAAGMDAYLYHFSRHDAFVNMLVERRLLPAP